jgi:hypothetical protein
MRNGHAQIVNPQAFWSNHRAMRHGRVGQPTDPERTSC